MNISVKLIIDKTQDIYSYIVDVPENNGLTISDEDEGYILYDEKKLKTYLKNILNIKQGEINFNPINFASFDDGESYLPFIDSVSINIYTERDYIYYHRNKIINSLI